MPEQLPWRGASEADPSRVNSARPEVVLLVVVDEEEEARVVRRLGLLEAEHGAVVLPVLDRGPLVQRVVAALQRAGAAVRVERAGGRPISENEPCPGSLPRPSRPDAVLVVGDVDPACQRLAAGLCGTDPVPLAAAQHLDTWGGRAWSALVLIDPRSAKTEEVLPALSVLASRAESLGFIYALDPVETRLALLKALAIDRLPGPEDMLLLSMQSSPDYTAGAPPCFADPSVPEDAARLHQPCDLLVLSGHANPLDAAFGRGQALCARAGVGEAPVGSSVFPCFASGECFRQPRMQREVGDARGLMSLRDVQARVVALVGCHMVALGGSWFDPAASLAYQCQQSAATAVFATLGLSIERLELNFLLMALLSEGRSFGEVARELNRVRLDLHRHATCLPDHVGPFLVLGNPCLRFARAGVVTREARWTSRRSFEIDLDGIELDRRRGAFVRVDLPPMDPPFLHLRATPDGVWCRGALLQRGERDALYLWLGAPPERDSRLRGALQVDTGEDPSAPTVRAVQSYARQLPFWMVTLDSFREDSGEGTDCAAMLGATLELLPSVARHLSLAANMIRSRPGVLADERRMQTLNGAVMAQAGAVAQAMLACLVEICASFGTMHSGGWENSFERIGVAGPLDTCSCGAAPVWGQRSHFMGSASLERAEYQCARCGAVGEDDGRRLLRLADAPAWVERGGRLRARCSCLAPADERVQLVLTLVLEGLYRGVRVVGEVAHATVEPGGRLELDIDVEVPSAMRLGVHPFAVVGVVNGASCIVRQMIEVRAAAK